MKTKYSKVWYKNRKELVSSYKTWIFVRNVKLIFIYFLIQSVILFFSIPEIDDDANLYLQWQRLKVHGGIFLSFIIPAIVLSICKETQHSEQCYIDDTLLGKETFHFFEIFPHKGIWVHRREALLYNLRAWRRKRVVRKRFVFSQCYLARLLQRIRRVMIPFLGLEEKGKKQGEKAS